MYNNSLHPYTKALISSIPTIDLEKPLKDRRIKLNGEIPNPMELNNKCKFYTRCKYSTEICENLEPDLLEVCDGHFVKRHNYKDIK